ncbi:hypothetical protein CSOJ01_09098 [Colletotrichum sojae]|uniref:Uncharacterized protein n=1 Tax=Colletotrichum sojae TaxID=2175907 RepID=A0A8H6J469_9PEZI|nr:hypothetical protein CSOJ01_09098 [Colletotrichum sojae]
MASSTVQSSGTYKPSNTAHFFGLIEKIKEVQEADPRGTWSLSDCAIGDYDPYEAPNPTDEWGIFKAEDVDFDEDRNDHDGIIAHKTACRNRPKTTADKIALAARKVSLPTDYQALRHYGFFNCKNNFYPRDHFILLTLYRNLIVDLHVTPHELDTWMKLGELYERIDAKIKARPHMFAPETIRGCLY